MVSTKKNRQYQQTWRRKHPDRAKQKFRETYDRYYRTPKGRAAHMLCSTKSRAKRLGIAFDLTADWLVEKLNGVCEVTGIPFDMSGGRRRTMVDSAFSPSIDRIDQSGGYTKDNVRLVIWIYNRARGLFSDADFNTFIRAYAARHHECDLAA